MLRGVILNVIYTKLTAKFIMLSVFLPNVVMPSVVASKLDMVLSQQLDLIRIICRLYCAHIAMQ
jgi:hypothetical protein